MDFKIHGPGPPVSGDEIMLLKISRLL